LEILWIYININQNIKERNCERTYQYTSFLPLQAVARHSDCLVTNQRWSKLLRLP